ncbi:MAG: hypothetical protein ABIU09_00095 [Pyrinomonadaceae bacterium]
MKICPTCRKTYSDDGLNFCLDDGSILTIGRDQLPETMMMNQPPFTDPNPGFGKPPGIPSSYGNQAAYSMQPKKSSKAWMWVVGILGILVLLCGGGGAAFLVYVASIDTNRNVAPSPGSSPTSSPTSSPAQSPRTKPSQPPFEKKETKSVDLAQWVRKDSAFGITEFRDGEFFMSSKQKGYYYVVAAPAEYKTESASTSVVLRNVDDAASSLGYGIVFHSDPKPLEKGYAFIIDSKKQKYRVARHSPGKETDVIDWTNSSAINEGSSENTLEVRDRPDRVELYINGEMVTSIKNTFGYKGGVVGLYSGDAVNIGFKQLEISK